jgi:hypothetical protein
VVPRRAKQKVLKKAAPARGAAATRAAEAKKAAGEKNAAADPADMASSRGQTAAVKKTAGATASLARPAAGDEALVSAIDTVATKADTESAMGRGSEGERPVAPPVVEKEQIATEEGGSPAAKLRER